MLILSHYIINMLLFLSRQNYNKSPGKNLQTKGTSACNDEKQLNILIYIRETLKIICVLLFSIRSFKYNAIFIELQIKYFFVMLSVVRLFIVNGYK